jgi:DNA-binding GntR family transcriptional regulator
MFIEKVSTKTIRQQIYDQLKTKIISAEISPGQVMTLQGLAKEFGVSVMPVREALWQLESEGAIVIESNKRIRVNSLRPDEMTDLLEIRIALESWMIERVCERITEPVLSELRHILEQMDASFGNHQRWRSLNSQFHFMVYGQADSSMFLGMMDRIWTRGGPYLNMTWLKDEEFSFFMKCHWNLWEALKERDGVKAKEWIATDVREAAKIIIPNLERSMAKPQETG